MNKTKDIWYMYGPLFFEWFLASIFLALPMTLILYWFLDIKFVFEEDLELKRRFFLVFLILVSLIFILFW